MSELDFNAIVVRDVSNDINYSKLKYSKGILLNPNKSLSFSVVFAGLLLLLFFSCKKNVNEHEIPDMTIVDYHFDGSISQQVLQNYLSRAIHMGRLGEGVGNTVDNIRMLKSVGAKYIGRVIMTFGKENLVPQRLITTRDIGTQIHAVDPDVILEGGIFEYVSTEVNTLPIPAYVFQDLGLPVETRNFRQQDMLYINNPVYDTGKVPDITYQETRLWFYYLATSYIDIGIESIHWGVIDAIGGNDMALGWKNFYDLFTRVRFYAKTHARRHFVLCNGDKNYGIVVGGMLLFDFHSSNLHGAAGIKEVADKTGQCYFDYSYKSMGGITPSGWPCTRLPYLVHFDNNGKYSGQGNVGGQAGYLWGYDEISWFANQPEEYRNEFLRYADNYISNSYTDLAGHLEMPGIRVITPTINGNSNYFANSRAYYPFGFNQEETIRQIWAAK